LASESRAEYFRNRRKEFKLFAVEIEREKMEKFNEWLREEGIGKTAWLNQKIDEELGK